MEVQDKVGCHFHLYFVNLFVFCNSFVRVLKQTNYCILFLMLNFADGRVQDLPQYYHVSVVGADCPGSPLGIPSRADVLFPLSVMLHYDFRYKINK